MNKQKKRTPVKISKRFLNEQAEEQVEVVESPLAARIRKDPELSALAKSLNVKDESSEGKISEDFATIFENKFLGNSPILNLNNIVTNFPAFDLVVGASSKEEFLKKIIIKKIDENKYIISFSDMTFIQVKARKYSALNNSTDLRRVPSLATVLKRDSVGKINSFIEKIIGRHGKNLKNQDISNFILDYESFKIKIFYMTYVNEESAGIENALVQNYFLERKEYEPLLKELYTEDVVLEIKDLHKEALEAKRKYRELNPRGFEGLTLPEKFCLWFENYITNQKNKNKSYTEIEKDVYQWSSKVAGSEQAGTVKHVSNKFIPVIARGTFFPGISKRAKEFFNSEISIKLLKLREKLQSKRDDITKDKMLKSLTKEMGIAKESEFSSLNFRIDLTLLMLNRANSEKYLKEKDTSYIPLIKPRISLGQTKIAYTALNTSTGAGNCSIFFNTDVNIKSLYREIEEKLSKIIETINGMSDEESAVFNQSITQYVDKIFFAYSKLPLEKRKELFKKIQDLEGENPVVSEIIKRKEKILENTKIQKLL